MMGEESHDGGRSHMMGGRGEKPHEGGSRGGIGVGGASLGARALRGFDSSV